MRKLICANNSLYIISFNYQNTETDRQETILNEAKSGACVDGLATELDLYQRIAASNVVGIQRPIILYYGCDCCDARCSWIVAAFFHSDSVRCARPPILSAESVRAWRRSAGVRVFVCLLAFSHLVSFFCCIPSVALRQQFVDRWPLSVVRGLQSFTVMRAQFVDRRLSQLRLASVQIYCVKCFTFFFCFHRCSNFYCVVYRYLLRRALTPLQLMPLENINLCLYYISVLTFKGFIGFIPYTSRAIR